MRYKISLATKRDKLISEAFALGAWFGIAVIGAIQAAGAEQYLLALVVSSIAMWPACEMLRARKAEQGWIEEGGSEKRP